MKRDLTTQEAATVLAIMIPMWIACKLADGIGYCLAKLKKEVG